jgi:hypothetical protein
MWVLLLLYQLYNLLCYLVVCCSVALFELEEYESSRQSFERSVQLCEQQGKKDVSAQNRWIRKCDTEIEGVTSSSSR